MDIAREQAAYRNEKPSKLGRGVERLTNPFGKAIAGLVPNRVMEAVVKGIDAAAGMPAIARIKHDTSDIEASRAAARRIAQTAKNLSGVTGAAAGFGGAMSAGLDIPATIGIALRTIRDTGRAYGFAGDGEAEKLFRLQILELAALDDPELRATRIDALEAAIQPGGALKDAHGDAATPMVDTVVERISRAIAFASFRKRLGMLVPVAGSAVGLLVNRSFQEDVAKAARFAFQARRLKTKP